MSKPVLSVRNITPIIGGRPGIVELESGMTMDREAPGSGTIVARVALAQGETVTRAVATARQAFDDGPWPRLSGLERSVCLNRLADLIAENRETLAAIDSEEVGKPIRIAEADVDGAIAMCRYAAALGATVEGSSITNASPDFVGMIVKEPIGVVALIVPWNFPLLILCQKLPFALAAGCTVVVKPSEFTSSSASLLLQLIARAGIPDGVVNLVTGAGSTGQALVEAPGVDMISFTGSTTTGKKVGHAAMETMKKVSLELGGKAATIVTSNADLEEAASGVAFGMAFNNGECCVAQPRLLVADDVADGFVDAVSARISKLRVGRPDDVDTEVGALISRPHLDKVLNYISLPGSSAEHGEITVGGHAMSGGVLGNGYYLEPTVIDGVGAASPLFREEIFAPVLSITRFETLDEAVALANSVSYGLGNSIWSKNVDELLSVAMRLKSGTVYMNTAIDGPPQMSFGGYKESGVGREMGRAGFEEFLEYKSLNIRIAGSSNRFLIASEALARS